MIENDFKVLTQKLNNEERHKLDFAPWLSFPYKPIVSFSILHTSTNIVIKFFVKEKEVRSVNKTINGPVWEDSCVEFFIAFDDKSYYNLEFNCIGTPLVGFGKGKSSRELLPQETIKKIKTFTSVLSYQEDGIYWELTAIIPLEIFLFHPLKSLKGKTCSANFYKCGDLLNEPHYLAWADIKSPEPNFHLPQFFRQIYFI